MRVHSVTVEPTVEPIDLAEAKEHLRIKHDEEDTYIQQLISTSRRYVEMYTHRALITQTIETRFDSFAYELLLPRPPLQSVSAVKYIDGDGVEQTVASSVYDVDTFRIPGRVTLAYSQTWPTPRQEYNAVRVTHIAGYGAAAANVDPVLRHAVLLMIANLYENREPVVVAAGFNAAKLPLSIIAMLDPHVVWGFH